MRDTFVCFVTFEEQRCGAVWIWKRKETNDNGLLSLRLSPLILHRERIVNFSNRIFFLLIVVYKVYRWFISNKYNYQNTNSNRACFLPHLSFVIKRVETLSSSKVIERSFPTTMKTITSSNSSHLYTNLSNEAFHISKLLDNIWTYKYTNIYIQGNQLTVCRCSSVTNSHHTENHYHKLPLLHDDDQSIEKIIDKHIQMIFFFLSRNFVSL